jgi:UDP-N-acetylglucosamine transferase subunit ALG13
MPETLDDAAEALNLTPQRITQLVKEGVLPRVARGEYEVVACLRAYVRYLQRAVAQKAQMTDDGTIVTTAGQRSALLAVQLEREQLELAKEKGLVMAVTDHYQVLAHLIVETKARVMAVGARVAGLLVGETSRVMIQAKIEAEHKIALTELAAKAPVMPSRSAHFAAGAVISLAGGESTGIRGGVSIPKKPAGGRSRQKSKQLRPPKKQLLAPATTGKRGARRSKTVTTGKRSPAAAKIS